MFEGEPQACSKLGPLVERLRILVDIYKVLHKARARRGALDFDAPEARFRIDSAEHVTAIDLVSRNDAHRLVEECMIMANVAVAAELARTRTPTLYRVHGQPEEAKPWRRYRRSFAAARDFGFVEELRRGASHFGPGSLDPGGSTDTARSFARL